MKDHDQHDDYEHEDEHDILGMMAEVDAFAYEARVGAMNFAMHIGKERGFKDTSEYVKSASEIYAFLIKDCLVPVEQEEAEASAMGVRN